MFTTQEERDNAQRSYLIDISTAEISDFPNHPFHVRIHNGLGVQGLENLNAYLYGDEMAALQNYSPVGLPYCAGYACGYYLIKHYLNKTGKTILEATLLPVSEILNHVEDFWNE